MFDIRCWKCKHDTRVGLISYWYPHWKDIEQPDTSSTEGIIEEPISYIKQDEIPGNFISKLNTHYGTRLKFDYSETMHESYLMNHCAQCGAKIGDWPMIDKVISERSSVNFKKVYIEYSLASIDEVNLDLVKRKAREQEINEYKTHNYTKRISVKITDFFYRSGKKYREIYYQNVIVRDDTPVGISVWNDRGKKIFSKYGEIDKVQKLSELAVKADIDKNRFVSVIIDEREWLPWERGLKYELIDTDKSPFIFSWDNVRKEWIHQDQKLPEICYPVNKYDVNREQVPIIIIEPPKRKGICVFCGENTIEWWSFNGKNNTCKCNKCREKGLV